ncbi:hypothetical protein I79_012051 [Cricetulus griseus]|uniref:Uncharacterized protein n=1 Tax=Cricetulus griseus TaxID=10029 RepID=G3HMS9_CRIGR|nr:hypothetical protein I79_012051 [Cricetulus griseus]
MAKELPRSRTLLSLGCDSGSQEKEHRRQATQPPEKQGLFTASLRPDWYIVSFGSAGVTKQTQAKKLRGQPGVGGARL